MPDLHRPSRRVSFWVPLAAALTLSSGLPAAHAAQADLAKMVQAEYDFGDLAKARGYKASFLEYLSADNVMFANGPVPGRKRVSERPDLPGSLEWYPDFAVVSSSGDLGLSTGPWVYSDGGKAVGFGHFFSIWRKQADGRWKNALDVGIDHDEIRPAPQKLKVSAATGHADSAGAGHSNTTTGVREAEAQFAQLAATSSYSVAVEGMASTELRVYRNGNAPVVGAVPAVALLKELGPVGAPKLDFASGSGDFGYSYGSIARREGQGSSHSFVHVWQQKNGKWQLLGDLLTPIAEAK